jgi:ribonuclease HI
MSIRVFTDGSSRGNPGPGGWGAIVATEKLIAEHGGFEETTTNNRMELMAAIMALEWIRLEKMTDESILVFSDSKYVIQGITEWIKGWQKNGWRSAGKKSVLNRDLWERLSAAASGLSIEWKYVAGHAGHAGNERCDEIATAFADRVDPHLYIGSPDLYRIKLDNPGKI